MEGCIPIWRTFSADLQIPNSSNICSVVLKVECSVSECGHNCKHMQRTRDIYFI